MYPLYPIFVGLYRNKRNVVTGRNRVDIAAKVGRNQATTLPDSYDLACRYGRRFVPCDGRRNCERRFVT